MNLQTIIETIAKDEALPEGVTIYGGLVPGGKELWPAVSVLWADDKREAVKFTVFAEEGADKIAAVVAKYGTPDTGAPAAKGKAKK